MSDPNDSDGSWEFVDKDSDSETSSVTAPYDTGLPEESLNLNGGGAGNGWQNNDDFITDSDIEACAEEPVESEVEDEETEHLQSVSDPNPDLEISSDEKNDQEENEPQLQVTESMLKYDDENEQKEECLPVDQGVDTPMDPELDVNLEKSEEQASFKLETDCDVTTEQRREEEVPVAHEQSNDIITDEGDSPSEDARNDSPTPSVESSVSEFEKLDTPEPPQTDPVISEVEPETSETNEVEHFTSDPNAVEDLSHKIPFDVLEPSVSRSMESNATESDSGSSEFTVISAHTSPSVEIHTQETTEAEDDDHEQVVQQSTNQNTVSAITDPIPANHRSVGIVTDHVTLHNQRFLISIVMISFGFGFLLGRIPIPSEVTLIHKHDDGFARTMQDEQIFAPRHLRDLPHLREQLQDPPVVEVPYDAMRKLRVRNEILRNQLVNDKRRLQFNNAELRATIANLRQEVEGHQIDMKMHEKMRGDSARIIDLLQTTCSKQAHDHRMAIASKDKELEQLKANLSQSLHESRYFNRSMVLYKKLQFQHFTLLALHKEDIKTHKEEQVLLTEENNDLKRKMQDQENEMKDSRIEIIFLEEENSDLKKRVDELDMKLSEAKERTMQFKGQLLDSPLVLSPLMTALANQEEEMTCPSSSKFKLLNIKLKFRVGVQRSLIRKLEEHNKLQSTAIEKLYSANGKLSNSVVCLRRQVQSSPQDRAKDPISFCGHPTISLTSPSDEDMVYEEPSTPSNVCGYPVNGSIAEDLSILNLSVQSKDKNRTAYKIKIFRPPTTNEFYFNATPIFTRIMSYEFSGEMVPFDQCKLLKPQTNKMNESSALGSLVPALWYRNAVASNTRARHQIIKHKEDLWKMNKVCKVAKKMLKNSQEEVANTRSELMLVSEDFVFVKKQNRKLSEQLMNATKQLKNPTLKQCIHSAMNTEHILKKINETKSYEVANKITQKVKKASRKAWKKVSKFLSKFKSFRESGGNEQDEFDDLFHDELKRSHETPIHENKYKILKRKGRKSDEYDDDLFEEHQHEFKASHEASIHEKKIRNGKRKNRESEHDDDELFEEHHHEFRKSHKEREFEQKRKPVKGGRKYDKKDDDVVDSIHREFLRSHEKSHHYHKEGQKHGQKKFKFTKHPKGRHQGYKDKMKQQIENFHELFEEIMGETQKQSKITNDRVLTKLMPIYEHFHEKYCSTGNEVLPGLEKDFWCPRVEVKSARVKEEFLETTEEDPAFYFDAMEVNNPHNNHTDDASHNGDIPSHYSQTLSKDLDIDIVRSNTPSDQSDGATDPEWYAHMSEAREKLRKGPRELRPLTDQEFDWYLKLFAARDEMRESGDSSYPSFVDSEEMNWHIKMFEKRAKLRFEKEPEQNNWYLKMFEERDRVRGQEYKGGKDWYLKMAKAREGFRSNEGRKGQDWYQQMAKSRETARNQLKGSDGDWFQNRMKLREKDRYNCHRFGGKARSCTGKVSSMSEHRRHEKNKKRDRKSRTIIR